MNNLTYCSMCRKQFYNHENIPWCPVCTKEMNEAATSQDEAWEETQKKSKEETASESESEQKIQAREQRTMPEEESSEKQTLKSLNLRTKSATIRTRSEIMQDVQKMREETGKESAKQQSAITTKNTLTISQKFPQEKTEETPQERLLEPSVNLNKELLVSVNSLTNLESELFETMKGLRSIQPDPSIRTYDAEKSKTAIECAKQIINSKRMKLDLFKFANEIMKK